MSTQSAVAEAYCLWRRQEEMKGLSLTWCPPLHLLTPSLAVIQWSAGSPSSFTSCSNAHVAVLTCTGYFAFFFKRKMDFARGTPIPRRPVPWGGGMWMVRSFLPQVWRGEEPSKRHTYACACTCKRRVNTVFSEQATGAGEATWGEVRQQRDENVCEAEILVLTYPPVLFSIKAQCNLETVEVMAQRQIHFWALHIQQAYLKTITHQLNNTRRKDALHKFVWV